MSKRCDDEEKLWEFGSLLDDTARTLLCVARGELSKLDGLLYLGYQLYFMMLCNGLDIDRHAINPFGLDMSVADIVKANGQFGRIREDND